MKYQIGSLVKLRQGDTSNLYLVVGKEEHFNIPVKEINELDKLAHRLDVSMVKPAKVKTSTHNEILSRYLKTKAGITLIRALMF